MGMMSGFSCFVNAGTLQKLYQLNDDQGALQIYLPTADLEVIKPIQARLREALVKAGYEVMSDDRVFFLKFENVSREGWTARPHQLARRGELRLVDRRPHERALVLPRHRAARRRRRRHHDRHVDQHSWPHA